MTELSLDAKRRYARHLTLPEVGAEGQVRLAATSVLVVGAGGLGSPVALYLAAAGVGRLGLVDADRVELSNLQRQVLYGDATLGARKVTAAAARLADLNPLVRIEPHDLRLTSHNAREVLAGYDVVVDGTDNFPTRYLLNDACVQLGKPLVYGSIFRFEGQVTVFDARRGPCYRCLFPAPPPPELAPSCAEGGVLGVLPGLVGTLQASEAIKLALGIGEPLVGRLLTVDALTCRFLELRVRKSAECPACGERPTLTELVDYEAFCGVPAADREPAAEPEPGVDREPAAAPGATLPDGPELWPREAAPHVRAGRVVLVDVREPFEWDVAHLAGATLIPLGELRQRVGELPRDRPLLVYCHHGQRSRSAVTMLRAAGFERAYNLTGGIDAWSREVDTSLARY